MDIIKRDGRKVKFDRKKIEEAVLAAFKEVDGEINDYALDKSENIAKYIEEQAKGKVFTVEQIQDLVEKGLMSTKRKDVARAYVTYRNDRTRARGSLTDKTMLEYLAGENEYWNTENSNKDGKIVTTQRDLIAGIASTDIARRFLLPQDVCDAHDRGIIHQHKVYCAFC